MVANDESTLVQRKRVTIMYPLFFMVRLPVTVTFGIPVLCVFVTTAFVKRSFSTVKVLSGFLICIVLWIPVVIPARFVQAAFENDSKVLTSRLPADSRRLVVGTFEALATTWSRFRSDDITAHVRELWRWQLHGAD